jgi:hypothetical protein
MLTECLRRVILQPSNGIAGLVDELLQVCREHSLFLDWHDSLCRVRFTRGYGGELLELPLAKSRFRMILARVAALANEQKPDAVSPYGGEGQLLLGTEPALVIRFAFANTPDAQWLALMPIVVPDRGEPKSTETSQHWSVFRQDDNGNRFIVERQLTHEAALHLVAELESRGHKQIYWAQTDPV